MYAHSYSVMCNVIFGLKTKLKCACMQDPHLGMLVEESSTAGGGGGAHCSMDSLYLLHEVRTCKSHSSTSFLYSLQNKYRSVSYSYIYHIIHIII